MKKIWLVICALLMAVALAGCAGNAAFRKSVDITRVQSEVKKGKTTMQEVEQKFGEPYEKGISSNGNAYYYYTSMNFTGSGAQDFTFYFDKKGRVAKYASEYPNGNPLLK